MSIYTGCLLTFISKIIFPTSFFLVSHLPKLLYTRIVFRSVLLDDMTDLLEIVDAMIELVKNNRIFRDTSNSYHKIS
jgi:hypothetical protein